MECFTIAAGYLLVTSFLCIGCLVQKAVILIRSTQRTCMSTDTTKPKSWFHVVLNIDVLVFNLIKNLNKINKNLILKHSGIWKITSDINKNSISYFGFQFISIVYSYSKKFELGIFVHHFLHLLLKLYR